MAKPRFSLRRNAQERFDGINFDDFTVLHLAAGTERNEKFVPCMVSLLNAALDARLRSCGIDVDEDVWARLVEQERGE